MHMYCVLIDVLCYFHIWYSQWCHNVCVYRFGLLCCSSNCSFNNNLPLYNFYQFSTVMKKQFVTNLTSHTIFLCILAGLNGINFWSVCVTHRGEATFGPQCVPTCVGSCFTSSLNFRIRIININVAELLLFISYGRSF